MDDYLIFSLKMSAWFGKGGVYVSDIKEAKHMTREAAIEFCRKRFGILTGLEAMLVAVDDIEAVMKK